MCLSIQHKEILKLFCKKADDIKNSSVFNCKEISFKLEIKAGSDGYLKSSQESPHKESVIALVTVIRQLYAQKEEINFYKVYNIIWRFLSSTKNSDRLDFMKSIRQSVDNILIGKQFNIKFNNVQLTPEKLIDIWFNGNIFHSDSEKIKAFSNIINSEVGGMCEFLFKVSIINLGLVFIYFADFIRKENIV